jgi:hypothetical protein
MQFARCDGCGLTQTLQGTCRRCGRPLGGAIGSAARAAAPPNPFVSMFAIFIKPRQTIRAIVDEDPTQFVILLTWLSASATALGTGIEKMQEGESRLPFAFYAVLAVYVFPPLAFAYTYTAAALITVVGGWLGGDASFAECRAALAWASIPLIATVPPLFIPHPIVAWALSLLFALWAMVLQVACIAEVHRFAAWRAMIAALLAWILILASLIGFVVALVALLPSPKGGGS